MAKKKIKSVAQRKRVKAEVPQKTPVGAMLAALDDQGGEIERFLKVSKSWAPPEVARVLIGWMGTSRARQMNDFLEGR